MSNSKSLEQIRQDNETRAERLEKELAQMTEEEREEFLKASRSLGEKFKEQGFDFE
ncbi:hypothetical protein [Saccharicrinis sp. FJH54]|uniref:hypothetical protein n=1 Tax=Saccharicrinis sp. FJH54 TaxID=3344665 RepID=UPI0035D3D8B6